MEKVRISPKYQIVTPKSVRRARPRPRSGRRDDRSRRSDRRHPREAASHDARALKGIDTTVERESDRA